MRFFHVFLMIALVLAAGCGKSANDKKASLSSSLKNQSSAEDLCGNTYYSQFRNDPSKLKITLTKDWIASAANNNIHVVVNTASVTPSSTESNGGGASNTTAAPSNTSSNTNVTQSNTAPSNTTPNATSNTNSATSMYVGDNCLAESSLIPTQHLQSDEVIAQGTVLTSSYEATKNISTVVKDGLQVCLNFPQAGTNAQRIKSICCHMSYTPNEDFRLTQLKGMLERDGSMKTNISSDPKCKQ